MPRWWQFIPRWNQSPLKQIKYASINARSETVADKPVYQEAWRQGQRCLIPTSSFYEFAEGQRVPGAGKTPYRVTHKSQDLMMLAGLYEQINIYSGLGHQTVTILTTQATETLLEIHERQPVTLDPSDWSAWLDPSTPSHRLKVLLVGKQDLFTTKLASWQAEVQAYDKPSTILTND